MKEIRNYVHSAIIVIFVCFPLTTASFRQHRLFGLRRKDPEESMNAKEVIRYHGYPVEEYKVSTEDGYILTIQRIPHGKNNRDYSIKRMPVLFQHGLLAASTCWIFDLPNKTLPFMLADRGYDVWLGNYRGNSYGRQHILLNPNRKEFWTFSLDQLGIGDLPAIIDFILHKTGSDQVHYVGHSMGTTGAFIMLSERTEYNKKIRSFHAFAPVARLDHNRAPLIRLIGKYADQIILLLKLLKGYEFLPNSKATQFIAKSICKSPLTNKLCTKTMFTFFGFDFKQLNKTRLPVYGHFFPAGTSAIILQHFGQIYKNHRFAWYDYINPLKNVEIYNTAIPPLHDISKITAPVYLYYGDNDWLAQPQDVAYIADHLPKESLKQIYRVPFDKWNHLDFLTARDVIPLLYEKVIENLNALDDMNQVFLRESRFLLY